MAEAVEISSQVREIINRSNVQLRSLAGLPEGLIDVFLQQKRDIVIIFRGKPVKALFLARIDDEIFEVHAPELVPCLRHGAVVLVAMPGGGRRYVIQASVSSIFAEKVRLTCLDPRFSERIVPESEVILSYRRVPDEVEIAVKDGGLKVFRTTENHVIEKVALENDNRNPPGFEARKNFAVLADISSGGCGLFSRVKVDPVIVNHLLYIENEDSASCRIGLFGVARVVRADNDGGRVHLMFIARIPDGIVKKVAGG